MINLDQSTQPTYKEEWTVRVGNDKFTLNEKEMGVLFKAIDSGTRGLVRLKDRGFSIAHLQSYWLESRKTNQLKLDRPEATLNESEKERIDKKLKEIRDQHPFLKEIRDQYLKRKK